MRADEPCREQAPFHEISDPTYSPVPMPRNRAYAPIPADDVQILGKVVGVLRIL
ncbi:hypothetical protein [Streptomyces sp. NPDC099088]|uniref:hypothetical protein n=1 Tax=Streptomyces sp. NPDC099088 TaxID=3366101 RepID=UPI003804436E